MKKIFAWLVMLSLLVSLAACGASETKKSSANAQTESVSIVEGMQTDSESDTTEAPSGPTEEDLELLETILFWGNFFEKDYNCKKKPILDYIWGCGAITIPMEKMGLLKEDENYVHCEYYEPDGRVHGGEDPRGLFADSCYRKIRADVMEYYLENVFQNKTYTMAREKFYTDEETGEKTCLYYYADGWYYFYCEHFGLEDEAVRISDVKALANDRYRITAERVRGDGFEETPEEYEEVLGTIRIDAALTEQDGRKLWNIYSTQIVDADDAESLKEGAQPVS